MKNMTHYILLITIILFSEKNVSADNGVISIVGEFGGYGDRTVHIVTVEKGKRYAIKRPYRDIDSFGGDIDMDLIIRPLGGHDPWFYEYAEFIEFGTVMRKKIAERDERKRQEYEKYLARVKERAMSRENDNKLSVFIIVVILFAIFYAVSFGRQRQRAEEIRKQQQRAEAQQAEEDNKSRKSKEKRQEQERYRQAEELRQQKQWADAHQAEENRRRAEELRRKEEELRRQAEEIKRQKERLDEELKNRRESQAKNIIYPRTLQEAFEVLGTHSGLTLEEYKKIFRNEVIKYHPDKTKSLGERLQKQAEEEMKAINMAWDIIKRSI